MGKWEEPLGYIEVPNFELIKIEGNRINLIERIRADIQMLESVLGSFKEEQYHTLIITLLLALFIPVLINLIIYSQEENRGIIFLLKGALLYSTAVTFLLISLVTAVISVIQNLGVIPAIFRSRADIERKLGSLFSTAKSVFSLEYLSIFMLMFSAILLLLIITTAITFPETYSNTSTIQEGYATDLGETLKASSTITLLLLLYSLITGAFSRGLAYSIIYLDEDFVHGIMSMLLINSGYIYMAFYVLEKFSVTSQYLKDITGIYAMPIITAILVWYLYLPKITEDYLVREMLKTQIAQLNLLIALITHSGIRSSDQLDKIQKRHREIMGILPYLKYSKKTKQLEFNVTVLSTDIINQKIDYAKENFVVIRVFRKLHCIRKNIKK